MHRRDQLISGKATSVDSPIVAKKAPVVRREQSGEGSLDGAIVPRTVSRTGNQRREARHAGFAESALVRWEDGEAEAKILNVSERGLMMEAATTAWIGEKIEIRFEGCDPIAAAVIWRKGSRLGVDFGRPAIDLVPEA